MVSDHQGFAVWMLSFLVELVICLEQSSTMLGCIFPPFNLFGGVLQLCEINTVSLICVRLPV